MRRHRLAGNRRLQYTPAADGVWLGGFRRGHLVRLRWVQWCHSDCAVTRVRRQKSPPSSCGAWEPPPPALLALESLFPLPRILSFPRRSASLHPGVVVSLLLCHPDSPLLLFAPPLLRPPCRLNADCGVFDRFDRSHGVLRRRPR